MVFFNYLCQNCDHTLLATRKPITLSCPKCESAMTFVSTIYKTKDEVWQMVEERR
jgi:Zn finger protein HypA/HybF involved in hydrogenase expression